MIESKMQSDIELQVILRSLYAGGYSKDIDTANILASSLYKCIILPTNSSEYMQSVTGYRCDNSNGFSPFFFLIYSKTVNNILFLFSIY